MFAYMQGNRVDSYGLTVLLFMTLLKAIAMCFLEITFNGNISTNFQLLFNKQKHGNIIYLFNIIGFLMCHKGIILVSVYFTF